MSKKIRFDFTQEQVATIIQAINSSSIENLGDAKDMLIGKYLKRASDNGFISRINIAHFDTTLLENRDVMAMIIHAISILTGIPENEINPKCKLEELYLTPSKLDQLRIHINKYIHTNGGTSYITSAQMATLETVKELYDLTQSKLP